MEQINKSLSETWKRQRLQIYDFMFGRAFFMSTDPLLSTKLSAYLGERAKNISTEVAGGFKEKIPKFSFRLTAELQSALEIAMHGCNGTLPNQSTYTVAQPEQFSFSMIKNLFVLIFRRTSVFATFINFY